MKNLFYVLGVICTILIIHSCKPCPDCPDCPEDESTLTTGDTISVTTFNNWRADWETYGQGYTDTLLTKYFTMPLVDITEFEDNRSTRVVAARFVIGLDMTDTMPHIMLVGVDDGGNDVIDYANGQYVYDVTKPCPRLCGRNSLPD